MVLSQTNLREMMEVAVVAARLAGQRAMEEINYVTATVKSEDQLVTQADTLCQRIIIDQIKQRYPDAGFIGEEGVGGKMYKQEPRGGERIWWVIDPIDGTNNFAKGMYLFAVAIAAMYEGRPVVGVIFEPAAGLMFAAVEGGEAQCNDRRITVSEDGFGRFSSIGMDSYFDGPVPAWALELMQRARFRNLGSSILQLGYLAKGALIANVFVRPKLWDIAPGALITQCAGGIVSDWKGNKLFPVDLDKYDGQEMPTVAANKKVYAEVLGLLR